MNTLIWWVRCKIAYYLFFLNKYFEEIGFIKKNVSNKL